MTKEEAKLVLDNARPETKEIDRQFYDDEDLNNALDMAIKALEQQPSDDCVVEDLINQVNEQGNKKITNWLDNFFKMEFPKTFDEFANDYGFTDDKEIYTNGSHLIPVFRVKQWLDHIEQQPSEDCVSRAEVLKQMKEWRDCEFVKMTNPYHYLEKRIQSMPPVTPTQSWIPVSERLPKQEVDVLTSNEYGFIEIQSLEDGYWKNQFGDCEDLEYSGVVVWQPLPKPYEEKRGNEDGMDRDGL